MKQQRLVVVFSFVIAAVITPTPDPLNQVIMAVPIIVLYQISVLAVWVVNRQKQSRLNENLMPSNSEYIDTLTAAPPRELPVLHRTTPGQDIVGINGKPRRSPPVLRASSAPRPTRLLDLRGAAVQFTAGPSRVAANFLDLRRSF